MNNPELFAFADKVRIACAKTLLDLSMNRSDRAMDKIDALCTEAVWIVNTTQMIEEVSTQNYDLTSLKVELEDTEPEV